jgi:hypothetical protein
MTPTQATPPPAKKILRPGVPSVVSPADMLARESLDEVATFIPGIPNDPIVAPKEVNPTESEVKAAETVDVTKELTPLEKWHKGLEQVKITETQAYDILDALISKGYYEREYKIWGNRVRVMFRTRDTQHLLRVQRSLEALRDPTQFSISQTVFKANVAASLVSYQSATLPIADPAKGTPAEIEEAYVKRSEFVAKLPGNVYEQLTIALAHFDSVVNAACAEGAAQAF